MFVGFRILSFNTRRGLGDWTKQNSVLQRGDALNIIKPYKILPTLLMSARQPNLTYGHHYLLTKTLQNKLNPIMQIHKEAENFLAMDEASIIVDSRMIWLIIKVLRGRVTYNGHSEHLRSLRYLETIKDISSSI